MKGTSVCLGGQEGVFETLSLEHTLLSTRLLTLMHVKHTILQSIKHTNNMRYTIFFITVNALCVSGSFSVHHHELQTVHTSSGICQACLLLLLVWVICSNSPTLAVAANKLDIYQMLCVQFGAHDDGARNHLRHGEQSCSNSPMLAVAASKLDIY